MLKAKVCLILGACQIFVVSTHATTAVGSCKAGLESYTTISEAISATAPFGKIEVCPGTYPEQLIINKPISIEGLSIEGKGGVTIKEPVNGLLELPGGGYTSILVDNAGGAVDLKNLSIAVGSIWYTHFTLGIGPACEFFGVTDVSGITYRNTSGIIDHLNVTGQFGGSWGNSGGPGGEQPIPDEIPNCGSGIIIQNGPQEEVVIRRSVIGPEGSFGVAASGKVAIDHNIISMVGPQSIGISSTGLVSNNTISGSMTNYNSLYFASIGIEGGELVDNNVVQSMLYGIVDASRAVRNTVKNNGFGIVGDDVIDNLIFSTNTTYNDPTCGSDPSKPFYVPCPLPSVGIELTCGAEHHVRENAINGSGIGIINLNVGERIPPSNVLAGVTTASTSCSK